MPHRANPNPTANIKLAPEQPAFLEVSVDPAAHGEAGLGPIQRAVMLRTASGQELTFTLKATIIR
jgi:hypothetical protein